MVENLRTRALVTLLAMACVAFGLVTARPVAAAEPGSPDAAAAGPESGPESLRLEVDTSVLDAELGARLAEQLAAAVAELPLVGLPSALGQPRLRVRVIGFDENQHDYQLELELSGPGRSTATRRVRCEACNERRMVEFVLEQAVALVRRTWLESDTESAPGPTEGPREAESGESSRARSTRPSLTKTGVSGAFLLGAGLTSLTAGASLWLAGVERRVDPASARVELRDLRPGGAVSMGAGVLVTTIGAAMLAHDLRQHSARKRPGFSVRLTPTFVGVQFRQRF